MADFWGLREGDSVGIVRNEKPFPTENFVGIVSLAHTDIVRVDFGDGLFVKWFRRSDGLLPSGRNIYRLVPLTKLAKMVT